MYVTIDCYSYYSVLLLYMEQYIVTCIKFGRSLYIWLIWTSCILAMRVYSINPFVGLLVCL